MPEPCQAAGGTTGNQSTAYPAPTLLRRRSAPEQTLDAPSVPSSGSPSTNARAQSRRNRPSANLEELWGIAAKHEADVK